MLYRLIPQGPQAYKNELGSRTVQSALIKSLTDADHQRLSTGTALARDFLQAAGARNIFNSHDFA